MKSKFKARKPTGAGELDGKIIIITGGAGLLGRAFVKAVLDKGGTAIMAEKDAASAKRVLTEMQTDGNGKAEFERVDITDQASIRDMVDAVVKRHGKVDALVNNAYPRNPHYGRKFEDVTMPDFCQNIDAHLGGYFLTSQEMSRQMKRQRFGTIVNLASIYGFAAPRFDIYEGTDMTMPVEYAATKAGIIQLTRYLAAYLAPYNIRVNALSPGGVYHDQPEAFVKKYSEDVRLAKRMARPSDLVGPLVFLLSDASEYMTGQNLVVDGGWSL